MCVIIIRQSIFLVVCYYCSRVNNNEKECGTIKFYIKNSFSRHIYALKIYIYILLVYGGPSKKGLFEIKTAEDLRKKWDAGSS